jgi:hypothetical protein
LEQVKSSSWIPENLGLFNLLPSMVLKKPGLEKATHGTFNALFILVLEASDLPAFTNLTI